MNRILPMYLIIIILTGCAEQRIIDDLALINAVGYDLTEDSKNPLKLTGTFPIITKEGKYDRQTFIVFGKSSKSAREKVRYKTNLRLESGQLRVALFGHEAAKQGLASLVDSLVRDPSIGTRVKLALGKKGASEILTLPIRNEGQNSFYIEQFIRKLNRESNRENYNLYQFLRDYYDDGIDPILPVFMVEKNNINYKGIGLFQKDKLKGYLNPTDSRLLFLLREEIKHGSMVHEMKLDGKKASIMLDYDLVDHRVHIKSAANQNRSAVVNIEIEGDVLEYTGEEEMSDPMIQKKVEKILSDYINKNCNKLLLRLQELKVDPIGIGRFVRNNLPYHQWKGLDWHEVYPQMKIEVKSKVTINSSGKWK